MWFPDYIEEIETDFAAIYGSLDMWSWDGPRFVRFASRLPYYQGAVIAKIKADYEAQNSEDGESYTYNPDVERTEKVKLSDAMKGRTSDSLDILNYESRSNDMGDLFERVVVPSN